MPVPTSTPNPVWVRHTTAGPRVCCREEMCRITQPRGASRWKVLQVVRCQARRDLRSSNQAGHLWPAGKSVQRYKNAVAQALVDGFTEVAFAGGVFDHD